MAASPQADPNAVVTLTGAELRQHAEALRLIQPTSCPTCRHREQRILEREHRVARQRRRWAGRLIISVLVIGLGALAFYRFGHDPMASVQR